LNLPLAVGFIVNTATRLALIKLFSYTIGSGKGIHIDPYGNIVPCNCIRIPKINLLKKDIAGAGGHILNWVSKHDFIEDSE